MATPPTVELPLTLHVSKEAREKLARQAAANGTDLAGYVSQIVERSAREAFSLEQISGPVYQRFLESGTTDDELSEELERGKHELRAERRARRAS
jgi:hypothetical protein